MSVVLVIATTVVAVTLQAVVIVGLDAVVHAGWTVTEVGPLYLLCWFVSLNDACLLHLYWYHDRSYKY